MVHPMRVVASLRDAATLARSGLASELAAPRSLRVAMLSAHTSPLEPLGGGDAGGMNVYVLETASRLARRGVAVEIFTRATDDPNDIEVEPGVRVRSIVPGSIGASLMAASEPFDLVHSHYWLSGQIGLVARERRGIPLVHSMHTM